ncbi:STAS domain-containing protein [Candidatus Peregrinibacteria bacterium]|nr:STAS domain-containing protein [Candidatus Peregrinibacteria bacterium]
MADFVVEITDGKSVNVKVVHITGELDEVSVETLKSQLDPLLADSSINQLIFDFGNLEFINSKGIGYLVSVHTHLAKDGRTMKLAGASESVMDVLSLVGLTNIIPYHATLEEALG